MKHSFTRYILVIVSFTLLLGKSSLHSNTTKQHVPQPEDLSPQSYSLLYGYDESDEFVPLIEDENLSLEFNIDPTAQDITCHDYLPTICCSETACSAPSCQASSATCTCQTTCGCGLNVEVHGGVYPVVWIGRDTLPRFNELFRTPWVVGGHFGYTFSNCPIETYLEFNYAQANSRGFCFDIPLWCDDCITCEKIQLNQEKYSLYSGYLAARYHSPLLCNCIALYTGAKFGLVHHKKIDAQLGIICQSCTDCNPCNAAFFGNTVVSGGLHIGFDICIHECITLLITGELVASGPLKNNQCITIDPCLCPVEQTMAVGRFSAELAFPVTLGLQIEF